MKFSIITCTYNSEKYIKKNIDSVKNQTYKNYEHIFIDGFSSDKTLEIIKNYQSRFPNKVKIFQYPAKGISRAMNQGIKQALGEYIIHLHSDDCFFNQQILKKVNQFAKSHNQPDWIFGKANFINDNTKKTRAIPHRKIYHKARLWLLLITNYIPHQSVFLKKTVFELNGAFNEQYKNSMDYELWLRLTKNKLKSFFINEIICNFSVRSEAQSSDQKNTLHENTMIKKKYTDGLFLKIVLFINKLDFRKDIF